MSIPRIVLLVSGLLLGTATLAAGSPKERIACECGGGPHFGLFLSDSDGRDVHPWMKGPGSNYNASYSTDGKWIVFTSERSGMADIYRAHSDGTGLERLTNSSSFDDQGTLSPDGKTLAFVSTRDGGTANIWLLDLATHRCRNLTKNRSGNFRPSWSPDGKWIAFSSDRDTHAGRVSQSWELLQLTAVYIVHPDGTGLRRLTPLDEFSGSPKWSPDGGHIVYYQAPKLSFGSKERVAVPQIVSIDLKSGTQQVQTSGGTAKLSPQYINGTEIGYLTEDQGKTGLSYFSGRTTPLSELFNPSWSPDGRKVVYQKNVGNVATDHEWMERIPSADPRYDLFTKPGGPFPAFSADGRQIIFTRGSKLEIANVDGSHLRDLFDAGGRPFGPVSWSPDGLYIAIGTGPTFHKPDVQSQIAILRSDGSDLRMLTQGTNSSGFPSFSPDGKRLVYRVFGSEEGLRVLSLEDGRITKLTATWDNFPAWSPRGDRIAFTSLRTGDFEIYTIHPDGSDLRQLTHDHGNDAHPSWSPDGKRIAFTSSRAGWKDEAMLPAPYGGHGPQSYGEIFVMSGDGTDSRQLTDNQWEDGVAQWLPIPRTQKAASVPVR